MPNADSELRISASQTERQALLHLSWALRNDVRYLIFAWVEILPPGYPKQEGHEFRPSGETSSSGFYIYVQRVPMSVADADAWYVATAQNQMTKPTHPLHPSKGDGKRIETGALEPEPPDQSECLAMGLPFMPAVHGSLHVKGLFGVPDLETQRAVMEPAMLSWLNDNLYFPIGDYPEYLGAVMYVRHDARIRRVEQRLAPRPNGADDEVFRITTWPGASLTGCEIVAMEQRPFGISPLTRQRIQDSTFRVSWPRKIERVAFAILHDTDGLLWWHEPLPYLRTIKLSINPIARRKVVELRSRDGTLKDSYEVQETMGALATTSVIGEPGNPVSITSRYYSADNLRKRRHQRASLGMRWFDDPKVAATEVRAIIQAARSAVWIVDPYSVGEDLVRFGLAAQPDVPVEVLTSAKALRTKLEDREHYAGERLRDVLAGIAEHKANPNIVVRVMPGREPSIHDRFLVIDGRLWLSGNSLNSIGERPSMLVEVPEPSDIIAKLEMFRSKSIPFSQWFAEYKPPTRPGIRGWLMRVIGRRK